MSRRRLPATIGWVLITMLGCAVLVACLLGNLRAEAAVSKLIASSAFIATALGAGALGSAFGRVLLAGLVFSWFGDAFLIGSTQAWFLAGLVAFLFAHIAYVAAFSLHGVDIRWAAAAIVPLAATSVAASIWLTPHVPADMLVPVRAYTVVISIMVVTAIGARGAGATLLIPIGAIAFYFSDLAVAARQFVQPGFPPYVWGLPLYYGGQILLALSAGSARVQAAPSSESPRERTGNG